VDVVISNCVINLSPDKQRVFQEIFRVLKPGGELYISDVFARSRVPEMLREDPVLLGECLAGAMYTEDFRRMLRGVGCLDYRIAARRPLAIEDAETAEKLGRIAFESVTVRAFKLASLEDICEDYGQAVRYRGTIPGHPHGFRLDDHHDFATGKTVPVCGNTAAMVSETRFAPHFELIGTRAHHFGPFDCAANASDTRTPGDAPERRCC
jgi:SAM-dependent methyltransferase